MSLMAPILNVFPGFGLGYLYLGSIPRFWFTASLWLILLLVGGGIAYTIGGACAIDESRADCTGQVALGFVPLAFIWIALAAYGYRKAVGLGRSSIRPNHLLLVTFLPGLGSGYFALNRWSSLASLSSI